MITRMETPMVSAYLWTVYEWATMPVQRFCHIWFATLYGFYYFWWKNKQKKNIKKQYKSKLTNLLGFFSDLFFSSLLHWLEEIWNVQV